MSAELEIKRWTAKRKGALIRENYKGQTTVAEAARQHDLTPSEIEGWIEEAEAGMKNVLRATPRDVAEQYEQKLEELHEAYGEAMLENKAPRKLQLHLGLEEDWSGLFKPRWQKKARRRVSRSCAVGLGCPDRRTTTGQ